MKKYSFWLITTSIFLAVVLFLLVSAFKPINSLIKPPKVEGENLSIQLAFEESVGDNYLLKQPISGSYRSAYTFIDLDSDKDDEVIVFYSYYDAMDIIRMNVLDKIDNDWHSIADFESTHNQIQEIEFSDLNGDKLKEIIVGWSTYRDDFSKLLSVYEISEGTDDRFSIKSVFDDAYSLFSVMDINCDGVNDILNLKRTATIKAAEYTALYLSYSDDTITETGSTLLDRSLSSVTAIVSEYIKEKNIRRIYVDGFKIDSGMATDCFGWDNDKMCFESCGYDRISVSALTSRVTMVSCRDINSDGLIEVPAEENLPASSVIMPEKAADSGQSLIRWMRLDEERPETVEHHIINSAAGYSFRFDRSWIGKVTVENDLASDVLTFCELTNIAGEFKAGAPLFSVKTVTEESSVSYFSTYYDYLANSKGKYYYCRIYDKGEDFGITYRKIKNSLILG